MMRTRVKTSTAYNCTLGMTVQLTVLFSVPGPVTDKSHEPDNIEYVRTDNSRRLRHPELWETVAVTVSSG